MSEQQQCAARESAWEAIRATRRTDGNDLENVKKPRLTNLSIVEIHLGNTTFNESMGTNE